MNSLEIVNRDGIAGDACVGLEQLAHDRSGRVVRGMGFQPMAPRAANPCHDKCHYERMKNLAEARGRGRRMRVARPVRKRSQSNPFKANGNRRFWIGSGIFGFERVAAGSGKTKVLQALTEEMRGVYLYAEDELTPRSFLNSLAMLLGRTVDYGAKPLLMRFVVDKPSQLRSFEAAGWPDQLHRTEAQQSRF